MILIVPRERANERVSESRAYRKVVVISSSAWVIYFKFRAEKTKKNKTSNKA